MKNIIVGGIVAAAFATPALAQEAKTTEFYVGGIAGYDNVRISDGTDSGSKGGVVYGGLAGVTAHVGEVTVLGLEAELTGSTIEDSETSFFVPGDKVSLNAGRDISVSAIIGYAMPAGTLVYVKGGYTNARATLSYDDGAGSSVAESDNLEGYRIGAGAQIAVQPNLKLRAEYRFSDYGDYKYQTFNTGLSAKRHQVVVGLLAGF